MKSVSILGIRGIPAKYGGFETFAERLALFLVSKGWNVTVYCQTSDIKNIKEETWRNIRLVHIPSSNTKALDSIVFDLRSVFLASHEKQHIILTLGYNTAIFSILLRLKGIYNIINMDGLEWRRQKWSRIAKAWLYINEWAGSFLGNHLIADHPEIKSYFLNRVSSDKITVIPYCSALVKDAPAELLQQYGLSPNQYALVIARTEPENNILEIVSAFSRKKRNIKLVVLGRYIPERFSYHQKILDAASSEVQFLGTIYDKSIVRTLRFHARLYIHGHSVGGTNPSLVEALAASSPVLAHNNPFNRWVAGAEACYFKNEAECEQSLNEVLHNTHKLAVMRTASAKQHKNFFSDDRDLISHERLLAKADLLAELRAGLQRVSINPEGNSWI